MHMRWLLKVLKGNWKSALLIFTAAIAIHYAYTRGERYFSSTGFCISCHSMSYPEAELKSSSHFGPLGFRPECGDCHLPPEFFARIKAHTFSGIKDIINEYRYHIKNIEDFEKHRAEFAHKARVQLKRWDSSPCRVCHKEPQPSKEWAMPSHDRMKTEDITCIDCHQNLFHKKVPEEDISKGISEGRIVPR